MLSKIGTTFGAILAGLSAAGGALLVLGGAGIAALAGAFPEDEPSTPPFLVFASVFGVVILLASGFLYTALFATQMAASRAHRTVATVLLAMPIGLGISCVAESAHPELRTPGMVLAGFGALVLVCLVWYGPTRQPPGPNSVREV